MADSDPNELVFRGSSPEECETFVSTIRKRAFAEKKHRDDEWMAFLASGCFVGDAFYWFEDLDKETQEDWSRLRPALVARFGRRAAARTPSLSTSISPVSAPPAIIPTPAAAPPAQITSPSARPGRLKVLGVQGNFFGYIANETLDGTYGDLTKARDQALSISFASPQQNEVLEISLTPNSRAPNINDTLGITWTHVMGNRWMERVDYFAWCCAWSRVTSSQGWATEANVWKLSEDSELYVQYPKPNGDFEPLRPYIFDDTTLIWCKASYSPDSDYLRVRIVSEEAQ